MIEIVVERINTRVYVFVNNKTVAEFKAKYTYLQGKPLEVAVYIEKAFEVAGIPCRLTIIQADTQKKT